MAQCSTARLHRTQSSSLSLTLDGITATLTANVGVLNTTWSGFGVNHPTAGDPKDLIDAFFGTAESITITLLDHGVLQTPGLQIVASRGRKRNPRATGNGATAPQRAPHFSGRKGGVCRCTPQSTLDPLIKSDPASISTEVHDDVKLEDLYTRD